VQLDPGVLGQPGLHLGVLVGGVVVHHHMQLPARVRLGDQLEEVQELVSRLVGRRRRQDPLAALSEREREVLGLIAEGMSNRAIAARLYVTERTVEAHVTQIFHKLGLPESPDQHRRVLAVLAFLRA
jgi:DNA-binding NarL/FixJ family response regulator